MKTLCFIVLLALCAWDWCHAQGIYGHFRRVTLELGNGEAIAVADVNGDGAADLIQNKNYGVGDSRTIVVFTNDGKGNFSFSTETFLDDSSPSRLIPADLNGDGKVDLAGLVCGAEQTIYLANSGSGQFVEGGGSLTPVLSAAPRDLTVIDVNGDGRTDLAVTFVSPQWDGMLAIWTNTGAGLTFASTQAAGKGAAGVAAGDVNGDGRPDLITANYETNTLSVFTNRGDGTFTLSSSPVVGLGPWSVAAADVNGDGKVDLISGNIIAKTLTVLTNNGAGGFAIASTSSLADEPEHVIAADVNADGRPDLIAPHYDLNKLIVLTNNGSGHFVMGPLLPGGGSEVVIAADLDGDGMLDLITGNTSSSSQHLTLFFNTPAAGSVLVWGLNDSGQTNVPPAAQSGVTAIAAGETHTVALKDDGRVVAWGYNGNDEGGVGGQTTVPVAAQSGVVAIAAGRLHTVALKNDGRVLAWGRNHHGQTTVPVAAHSGVTAIAAGGHNTMALKNDGSVLVWGYNSSGQTDVPVAAQSGVAAIAAGDSHNVALKNDGRVVAWGNETNVPVPAQSGVVAIAAGAGYTAVLKNNGSVLVWGYSDFGQTNVPVAAQSGVIAIAAGVFHTVALRNDGSVLAWGDNLYGQTTVPVAAQSGVTAIAAGWYHTVALLGTVPLRPSLHSRSSGNQLILSWPTNAAGFTLQSTLQLTPTATWIDVTNPPALLGAQWTVTNTASGSAGFYRLRKP